jgi:hypothetical protein
MSTGAERDPRRVSEDVVVALHHPAELFSVQLDAMLKRDARLEPGADEIVNELLGRSKVQRQGRIVVTLPAEQITDDTAETLDRALRRYCEARLALVQRETQVAWRGFAHCVVGRSCSSLDCCSPPGFWSRMFLSSGRTCLATEFFLSSGGSVFGIPSTCSSSHGSR